MGRGVIPTARLAFTRILSLDSSIGIGDNENRYQYKAEPYSGGCFVNRRSHALVALSIAVLTAAGCSGISRKAREVRIIAIEMKFTPQTIQAKPGETINFVIDNQGAELHEFVSDEIKFHEVEVEPGEVKSVEVAMPTEPGEYPFYCEAKGHQEAGMVGKIVISK